jgi:all-trans-8'-apo-beta-carotenal 15,15'-oxygenase
LLAMWEQGHPYALDKKTLATIEIDNLGGLPVNLPFSAHPKVDPDTKEIYNFGVSYSYRGALLNLYRCDAKGVIRKHSEVQLGTYPMIHDFAIAGSYMVFLIAPLTLELFPFLTKIKSFSESLQWKPSLGTKVLIIDRQTFKVVNSFDIDPFFSWHTGNSFVDDLGLITIDLPIYRDFATNKHLTEMSTGVTTVAAPGRLYRLILDPIKGEVSSFNLLSERICEFTTVPDINVGKISANLFMLLHRKNACIGHEWYGSIGCYNYKNFLLDEFDCGEDRYVVSPVHASDDYQANLSWILSIVYDGELDQSEVWIFDSSKLCAGPVCRLLLPEVIPIGYHGAWENSANLV